MILYLESPKDFNRKLLELSNEYSKVVGYKINTQKSLAFLYNNNEKTEREIKETIPFTIAMERIKYLGIYLPKETKDLYIGGRSACGPTHVARLEFPRETDLILRCAPKAGNPFQTTQGKSPLLSRSGG